MSLGRCFSSKICVHTAISQAKIRGQGESGTIEQGYHSALEGGHTKGGPKEPQGNPQRSPKGDKAHTAYAKDPTPTEGDSFSFRFVASELTIIECLDASKPQSSKPLIFSSSGF